MNYTKKTQDGKVTYLDADENKAVKQAEVPEEVKAALSTAKDGQVVDTEGNTVEPDDGQDNPDDAAKTSDAKAKKSNSRRKASEDESTGDDQKSEETASPAVDSGLEQDEAGMGFPRVNGSTVDVFDGKTPHTHVRNVSGVMVPLSEENFNKKTDVEIMNRVRELRAKGKVTV